MRGLSLLLTLTPLLITAAALPGCANPREDVRVTLCKDMVALELGGVSSWQGSEIRTLGYEGAVVTVRFATAGGEQRAECHYERSRGDDTGLTLANPIEAYNTSPSKLTLPGRTLTGPDLARAVKRAMEKQGHAFLDRIRRTLSGQ